MSNEVKSNAAHFTDDELIGMSLRLAVERDSLSVAVVSEKDKSQRFFHALALEIRKPSYGIMQRDFAESLLKRAQEAHLYEPEPT